MHATHAQMPVQKLPMHGEINLTVFFKDQNVTQSSLSPQINIKSKKFQEKRRWYIWPQVYCWNSLTVI